MPSRLFFAKLSARENFFLQTPPKGTKTTYGGSGESGESGGLDFRHSATNVTFAMLRIEK